MDHIFFLQIKIISIQHFKYVTYFCFSFVLNLLFSIIMNDEIPPAQDSPKHILNALDDYCIQSIFSRLDFIDLYNAAETCTRFRANVLLTFRTLRQCDLIINYNYNGHLITNNSFELNDKNGKRVNDFPNMIADYCGKTLRKFVIGKCDYLGQPNTANFNTRSPLQALTELEIINVDVYNFKYHSQLKKLVIIGSTIHNFNWFIQPFSKLKIVKFMALHKLQMQQAFEFLKLNPQLKNLNFMLCKKITPKIIRGFIRFTPNLEKLSLCFVHTRTACLNEHLVRISNFPNLKYFYVESFNEIHVESLIDSFIEYGVPMEVLGINSKKYYSTSKLNVLKMKLLKKLYLMYMSNETLIDYVKNSSTLEEVIAPSSSITISGIKKALKYVKQLSVLVVEMEEIVLNRHDFKSILKFAKLGRVKVTIYIKSGSVNVPNELLMANSNWVIIHMNKKSDLSMKYFNVHFEY